MLRIPLFLTLLSIQSMQGHAELTVAKLFSSGMVLQEAPATATIFGTYTEGPVSVTLSFEGQAPISLEANLDEEKLRWNAVLPPVSSGSSCNISISSGSMMGTDQILLENVLFGDVWFCAGQSNMGWTLGGTENNTEEMENAKAYENIRMYRIDDQPNSEPQYDIQEVRNGWLSWNSPSSEWPEGTEWEGGHWPRPIGDFSGICSSSLPDRIFYTREYSLLQNILHHRIFYALLRYLFPIRPRAVRPSGEQAAGADHRLVGA